jgi:hypothetical protein
MRGGHARQQKPAGDGVAQHRQEDHREAGELDPLV